MVNNLDAVEWLQDFPDSCIDLVITDPPYESLEKYRAIGTTTRLSHSKASSNDWFKIFPNERFPELFAEIYRVLKPDSHFYLFSDAETAFAVKPMAQRVGFKFWKPLVWDKCLAPDTPVCTSKGVLPIAEIAVGDKVALPEGGWANVRAKRGTQAASVRIRLSDGTTLTSSRDHRFMLESGRLVEACNLQIGDELLQRNVREPVSNTLSLSDVVPRELQIWELPNTQACLWCGRGFANSKAAAAHQARWCERAKSKEEMARVLNVSPKRLRRWMSKGRLPVAWAERLGLTSYLGDRVQLYLQNDVEKWFPNQLTLDYEFGKVVGLFAAEGSASQNLVSFALHRDEKHLRRLVARFARRLGLRSTWFADSNRCVVSVSSRLFSLLVREFVVGSPAPVKSFTARVYGAPEEFRRGVLDGLLEGDGHWSDDEQRATLNISSADLAFFAYRELRRVGFQPTIRPFDNDHAGGWRVRYDPQRQRQPVRVEDVEPVGDMELIDISIDHSDELFLLGNGVVTHNCKIGMGYHYRARYEFILFFEKGKRKLNDLSIPDVLQAPRVDRGYPTEKPVALSDILVAQSSEPEEWVCDPFMGSCSSGVAAINAGRRFCGTDICFEAVEVARMRLKASGATQGPPPSEDPGTQLRLL